MTSEILRRQETEQNKQMHPPRRPLSFQAPWHIKLFSRLLSVERMNEQTVLRWKAQLSHVLFIKNIFF